MTPLVIAAHGGFASALLTTAEMIIGPAANARAVDFEIGTGVDDLNRRMTEAVNEVAKDGPVLILVDLGGGSPSRVAATIALERNAKVLTGVNLPMVIAALTEDDADLTAIVEAGRTGIDTYGVPSTTTGGLR